MTSESFYNSVKAFFPALRVNRMPYVFVRLLAHGLETLQRVIPHRLTPATVGDLAMLSPATLNTCIDYVFSCSKAEEVLGYAPIYTVDQGIQKALREYESNTLLPPLKPH